MASNTTNVTIADVALKAGVSKAQAGRALGGYGNVSAAVAQRVHTAAKQLGYRPNALARSMSTGLSNTIGVIVGDIENPNFSVAIRGMADAARAGGYRLMLANSDEQLALEQEAARLMVENRVDGVIVAPCTENRTEHLADIVTAGRQLLLFDRYLSGLEAEAVCADFSGATRELGERLVALGHQRVAYISSRLYDAPHYIKGDLAGCPVGQRIDALLETLENQGLESDALMLRFNGLGREAVDGIVDELLHQPAPPTAVVASDGLIAQHVLMALKERQVALPQALSVMMYDDFEWASFMSPAMTVVSQPVYAMGHEAGRRMVARLKGEAPGAVPEFSARLVWRESVAQSRKNERDKYTQRS